MPDLYKHIKLEQTVQKPKDMCFLRTESFYHVATEVENFQDVARAYDCYQYFGGKSLHKQSHGESFLALFLLRFWKEGLYILYEPKVALSRRWQLALLSRIHELAETDSQFIIATQ